MAAARKTGQEVEWNNKTHSVPNLDVKVHQQHNRDFLGMEQSLVKGSRTWRALMDLLLNKRWI